MKTIVCEVSSSSYKFLLYDRDKEQKNVLTYPLAVDLMGTTQDAAVLRDDLFRYLGKILEDFVPDYICLVTTWHGLLYFTSEGETCSPLYLWSDTGSLEYVDRFKGTEGFSGRFFDITGCQMHPCYPFFKSMRYPKPRKDCIAGDLGSYLNLLFTGKLVTGRSMASGSGLADNSSCVYSEEMLKLTGLSKEELPEIADERILLPMSESAKERLGVKKDILIQIALPDGASNQLGALPEGNDMTLSVGTSSAMRVNVPEDISISGDKGLFLYRTPYGRLLGAATNAGTNLIEWYRNENCLTDISYDSLETKETSDLIFLPFVFGERSPSWSGRRRYGFVGSVHDVREGYRAVQEGILFNIKQCFDNIESVIRTERVLTSGGILRSAHFVQMCSDVLERELHVCEYKDASLLGALYLLHNILGSEIRDPVRSEVGYRPDISMRAYYRDKYAGYLEEYSK